MNFVKKIHKITDIYIDMLCTNGGQKYEYNKENAKSDSHNDGTGSDYWYYTCASCI